MQIRFINGRIKTTPGMSEYVHSQIEAAVGRFASHVGEVRALIGDVNGPRGGVDKRCLILAAVRGHGRGGGEVITRHGDADQYTAIAGAACALKHAVARRMDHHRTRGHGRG